MMTHSQRPDPALVSTHTTAAASAVAHWISQHHEIEIDRSHLIRRGLNDNYALRSVDGTRYVARLCSIRPRGAFNVDFEVALLTHLHRKGVGVAAPVLAADARTHIPLQFPEGPRALVLYRHVEGATPEETDEFELTGHALAQVHAAARDYTGPASRYTLDGQHLAGKTLVYLQAHPELGAALLATYRQLVDRLLAELAAIEGQLTRVVCHGDMHGFNNHVTTDAAGNKHTVLFDFDDAGPGFLAYDLAVLPWSYLYRKSLKEPDAALRERWAHYLRGYRAGGGAIGDGDLAALPLFIQLRHLWNIGEAASRLHHWGTSNVSADWLQKQIDQFAAWSAVDLRA